MDLRIKKTYRALFEAFTELLEEHRFEDVTVAMLCDRAMIRRTTFYKHFRDKNDYFAFYIDELMSGLPQKRADADGAEGAEDVRALRHEVFADAMDLILAHEQLMDNILASSMSGMLTSMICDRRRHYSALHHVVGIGPRTGAPIRNRRRGRCAVRADHDAGESLRVAERGGFEPPERSRAQRFSRPPHSTALPSLRES